MSPHLGTSDAQIQNFGSCQATTLAMSDELEEGSCEVGESTEGVAAHAWMAPDSGGRPTPHPASPSTRHREDASQIAVVQRDINGVMDELGIPQHHGLAPIEYVHAAMDPMLEYERFGVRHTTITTSTLYWKLCILFRTLVCLGVALEPITARHGSITSILPLESEVFVPTLDDTAIGNEGMDQYMEGECSSVDSVDGTGVGSEAKTEGGQRRCGQPVPTASSIVGRLGDVATTVEGSLAVLRAYRLASTYGTVSRKREYSYAFTQHLGKVKESLDGLLRLRCSVLELGTRLEPRTLVLQRSHPLESVDMDMDMNRDLVEDLRTEVWSGGSKPQPPHRFEDAWVGRHRDALHTSIREQLPEVVGHEVVNGYVSSLFSLGTSAWQEEEKLESLDSLIRARKVNPDHAWLLRHVYLGYSIMVANPGRMLRTPWLVFTVDAITSTIITLVVMAASWEAPGSRNSPLMLGLQLLVMFGSYVPTSNVTSMIPVQGGGWRMLSRKTFKWATRIPIHIPVIHHVYQLMVVVATITLALNTYLAYQGDHPTVHPPWVEDVEHVLFAFLSLLSYLHLIKFFLLMKGVGYIVIVVARAVNRVTHLALLCVFILVSFGSAMHAISAHAPAASSGLVDDTGNRFRDGVFSSSLVLSNMLLGEPDTLLFLDQASSAFSSPNRIYGVAQTVMLNLYGIGTYVFVFNLFIAVIASAYMPEETTTLFHATKSLFQYKYVQYARLEILPGPIGLLLGIIRFSIGARLSRVILSLTIGGVIIPPLALAWAVLSSVAVLRTAWYHIHLAVIDDSMNANLREQALFVYLLPIYSWRQRHHLSHATRFCLTATFLALASPLLAVAGVAHIVLTPGVVLANFVASMVTQPLHRTTP